MKIGEKIKKYGEIGEKLRNSQQEQEKKKLLRPLGGLAVKKWREIESQALDEMIFKNYLPFLTSS